MMAKQRAKINLIAMLSTWNHLISTTTTNTLFIHYGFMNFSVCAWWILILNFQFPFFAAENSASHNIILNGKFIYCICRKTRKRDFMYAKWRVGFASTPIVMLCQLCAGIYRIIEKRHKCSNIGICRIDIWYDSYYMHEINQTETPSLYTVPAPIQAAPK